MKRFLFVTLLFTATGFHLIKKAWKTEARKILLAVQDAENTYQEHNGHYTLSLKKLSINFKITDRNYQYGFNPHCLPDELKNEIPKDPNIGFNKKTFFTGWLQKQTCRINGYTFYAVKQKSPVDFEIQQINEVGDIKELKIP